MLAPWYLGRFVTAHISWTGPLFVVVLSCFCCVCHGDCSIVDHTMADLPPLVLFGLLNNHSQMQDMHA